MDIIFRINIEINKMLHVTQNNEEPSTSIIDNKKRFNDPDTRNIEIVL